MTTTRTPKIIKAKMLSTKKHPGNSFKLIFRVKNEILALRINELGRLNFMPDLSKLNTIVACVRYTAIHVSSVIVFMIFAFLL